MTYKKEKIREHKEYVLNSWLLKRKIIDCFFDQWKKVSPWMTEELQISIDAEGL